MADREVSNRSRRLDVLAVCRVMAKIHDLIGDR